MKKIYILLLLLILFPIKTNAIHEVIDTRCTTELKLSLKKEASEVTYRVTKNDSDGKVTYSAILYNISDNLYVTSSSKKVSEDLKIENIKPGGSILIEIYASNNTYCAGYKAGTKIIKAPNYNPYSQSDLCKGYENYTLCKEDANITLTEKEFEIQMKNYIESLKTKEDVVENAPVDNNFNLISFIKNYGLYIGIGVGVVAVITITIVIIYKRKNRGIL